MIDVDDSQSILELDRQAKNLSALDDVRLDREIEKIRQRAIVNFIAAGVTDIEAFFSADAIVARLRSLVANRRRAHALAGPPGGAMKAMPTDTRATGWGRKIFPRAK